MYLLDVVDEDWMKDPLPHEGDYLALMLLNFKEHIFIPESSFEDDRNLQLLEGTAPTTCSRKLMQLQRTKRLGQTLDCKSTNSTNIARIGLWNFITSCTRKRFSVFDPSIRFTHHWCITVQQVYSPGLPLARLQVLLTAVMSWTIELDQLHRKSYHVVNDSSLPTIIFLILEQM